MLKEEDDAARALLSLSGSISMGISIAISIAIGRGIAIGAGAYQIGDRLWMGRRLGFRLLWCRWWKCG